VLYLPNDTSKSKSRRCLQRTKTSLAVLTACPDINTTSATATLSSTTPSSSDRLVQFSLVRYHATSSSNLPSSSQSLIRPVTPKDTPPKQQEPFHDDGNSQNNGGKGLPKTRDIAHNHANDRVVRAQPLFEMNLATRPLLTTVTRKESTASPFAALQDSNPILFLGKSARSSSSSSSNKQESPRTKSSNTMPIKSSSAPTSPGKLRKMEVSPYIAASKDEIWVDPQTGLEYRTDLCRYLGHDRKESGRHTLMGVGQFIKTMLKIKVRGCCCCTVYVYAYVYEYVYDSTLNHHHHLYRSMVLPCTYPNVMS
jgi:hypothetical protein